MRNIAAVIGFLLVCLIGCREQPAGPGKAVDGQAAARACQFSLWVLDQNMKRFPVPFIKPEHVRSIDPAKPLYDGEKAIMVTLTDEGAQRMRQQTQQRIGSQVAAYCGDGKIANIMILGVVTEPFRVPFQDEPSVEPLMAVPGT